MIMEMETTMVGEAAITVKMEMAVGTAMAGETGTEKVSNSNQAAIT